MLASYLCLQERVRGSYFPHSPRFSRVNACKDGTGGEFHIPSMDRGGAGGIFFEHFRPSHAGGAEPNGWVGNYRCYACIRERGLVEKFGYILGV